MQHVAEGDFFKPPSGRSCVVANFVSDAEEAGRSISEVVWMGESSLTKIHSQKMKNEFFVKNFLIERNEENFFVFLPREKEEGGGDL